MSDDNWAICPKCLDIAQHEAAKEHRRIMDLYGSVPVEEFDKLRDALKPIEPETYRTFREDYEFYGAVSGEITASYSGHCTVCDLGLDFEDKRPFYPGLEREVEA
jgi:hypothetical protein